MNQLSGSVILSVRCLAAEFAVWHRNVLSGSRITCLAAESAAWQRNLLFGCLASSKDLLPRSTINAQTDRMLSCSARQDPDVPGQARREELGRSRRRRLADGERLGG